MQLRVYTTGDVLNVTSSNVSLIGREKNYIITIYYIHDKITIEIAARRETIFITFLQSSQLSYTRKLLASYYKQTQTSTLLDKITSNLLRKCDWYGPY